MILYYIISAASLAGSRQRLGLLICPVEPKLYAPVNIFRWSPKPSQCQYFLWSASGAGPQQRRAESVSARST